MEGGGLWNPLTHSPGVCLHSVIFHNRVTNASLIRWRFRRISQKLWDRITQWLGRRDREQSADGQISLARRFLVGTLSTWTRLLFISKWLKTVLNHIMAAGPIELYRKEVTFTACTLYILHTLKYFLCQCQLLGVRKVLTGLAECENS